LLNTPAQFLLLDGQPFLVASAPVMESDRSGPSPGWLIFGRHLGGSWIHALQQAVQLHVTIEWPNGTVAAGTLEPETNLRSVHLPLSDSINLRLSWPAFLTDQGLQTTRELAIALAILGAGAVVYLLLILRTIIFSRLHRLTQAVENVSPDQLQSDQPLVSGNDEIAHLGNALKQAMRRLTESERSLALRDLKHQAVLDQLPEGIFLAQAHTWQFIEANPACARLFNRNLDTFHPGTSLPDCLNRSVPPWPEAANQLTRKGAVTLQTWVPLDETTERKLEINLSRVTLGDETLVCGVVEDLTERDRLQEAVRRAEMAETVGALAGGVAHDFNNLLTVLVGGIEILRQDEKLSPAGFETIEAMDQAARSASDLTRKLLFYGRRSAIQLGPVDVHRLIDSLRGVIRRIVPENINLEISVESNLPPLLADARSIEQVILNLVLNARDAMPRGGRLSLAVSLLAEPHRPPRICFSFSDTGCGIPPEVQIRMFEPFFTTKETGQGSGLGLSMVDGIVRQHGGEIRVESVVGRGTTFHLFLPTSTEPLPADPPPPAEPQPTQGASVLLVEDEPGIRSLLSNMLTRAGFHCHAVATGRQALDWFNQAPRPPDVLVSDVIMPGDISGYDLAACLIAKAPDIKIIMISGYNQEMFGQSESVTTPWDPTRFRFLEKPFRAQILINEIHSLLDSHPA
ncbi:MAG: ATP-binding protein, partial [Verrucomicrobiia bacterium]